jgi:hypothetical protein
MPGYLVHSGAVVECRHGGSAQPMSPNPRVRVSRRPIAIRTTPYGVTRCPHHVGNSPSPCLTASWTSAARRVKASGVPVVLGDSSARTVPNAAGLVVRSTQTRVKGT